MKILVPIKRVVDYNVKVRPLGDQSDVDLNNVTEKDFIKNLCLMHTQILYLLLQQKNMGR